MKKKILLQASIVSASLSLGACGKGGGTATQDTGAGVDSSTASDPVPGTAQLALKPTAKDIATNGETQADVATSGIDSAASGAAAGVGGTSGGAALDLSDSPLLGMPSAKVTTGDVSRDCYLGPNLLTRPAGGTLQWPESTDATSVFAGSKTDATVPTNMSVEPLLLQYPATSPTAMLKLSAPFAFTNLVEVIQKDNRDLEISLNDKAQTSVSQKSNNEEHRFWVAANAITGQASAAMTCSPATGAAAKGASGDANGTFARIKWADPKQTDGLNLLARFTNSGSRSHSYLPRKKGVLASTPVSVSGKFAATGYRLVQWSNSAGTTTGQAFTRTKTVTHSTNRTEQTVDGNANVLSDLSHKDEVRAVDPLVIQSSFAADETPLSQTIQSGTVTKTATETDGSVKWFSTMTFAGVKFDLVNSTEVCIPVAGTSTMTVYDKEGGTQVNQITITYSGVPSAAGGASLDPQISVSGDDADGTQAKWMMLAVNRKCDLK